MKCKFRHLPSQSIQLCVINRDQQNDHHYLTKPAYIVAGGVCGLQVETHERCIMLVKTIGIVCIRQLALLHPTIAIVRATASWCIKPYSWDATSCSHHSANSLTHSAIGETTARIKSQDRTCYSCDPDKISTHRATLLHLMRYASTFRLKPGRSYTSAHDPVRANKLPLS